MGVALLPPGEDGQGVLPADEPGGTRPPQKSHAGGPASRRPRLPRGRGAPERSLPGAVRAFSKHLLASESAADLVSLQSRDRVKGHSGVY